MLEMSPGGDRQCTGDQRQMAPDLRTYARAIWRRKLIVVALLIAVPGAVYGVAAAQPKRYTATATVQIKGPDVSAATFIPNVIAPRAPEQTVSAAQALMTTREVAAAAAASLPRSRLSPTALLSHITTAADVNSAF